LSKDLSSLPKWGEEVVEDWKLLRTGICWVGERKKKKLSRIHLYHVVVSY
jgi:hypothetical protein